jgi:hypothetical protein
MLLERYSELVGANKELRSGVFSQRAYLPRESIDLWFLLEHGHQSKIVILPREFQFVIHPLFLITLFNLLVTS